MNTGHCQDCAYWGHPDYLDETRNGITFRPCGRVQQAPETPHSSAMPDHYAKQLTEKEEFDKTLTPSEFYLDDVELSGCSTLRTGPEFGCAQFTSS